MVLATVRVRRPFEKPAKGQLLNCFGEGGEGKSALRKMELSVQTVFM